MTSLLLLIAGDAVASIEAGVSDLERRLGPLLSAPLRELVDEAV